MKHLALLGAAVAFGFAAPAVAKHGNGHGHGHGYGDAYGYGLQGPIGYGIAGCPPGLAKKNNGCLPPGQAKKLYDIGQRFPLGYGHVWSYNRIPYDLRSRYGLDPYDRYYRDGYLYGVDPRTMLIQQVIAALLR